MPKLVYGVGVSGNGKYRNTVNGRTTKEYRVWAGMLKRCYCKKFQEKSPHYIGCSVSDNFKNFQYFAEWCNNQTGFGKDGYHLDKDILIKGNKIYSEEFCVFVPDEINYFYIRKEKSRGKYLIGTCLLHGKFKSTVSVNSNQIHLGMFNSEIEAFTAYKNAKEALARNLAECFKDLVDYRVVESLQNVTVKTTD